MRDAIKDSKEEIERRKAIAEKRKNGEVDPEEAEAREANKAAEKARQEVRERIKRLEAEADQIEDETLTHFSRVFGFAVPDRDERGNRHMSDPPASIRGVSWFNEYQPKEIPKTIDAVEFRVDVDGDAAHMHRVAKATGWGDLAVRVRLETITLAQALQIEKLLGRAVVSFHSSVELKGRDVRKLNKQLAGVGAASAPESVTGSNEQHGDLDVAAFIAKCLDRSDPDAKTKAADVHAAYVRWCKKRKATPLSFKNRWGEAIIAAGIEKKRLKTGYHYLGVSLK